MASIPPSYAFNCRACGAGHGERAWRSLVLAETLEPRAVSANILGWPEDTCIEVRVCRCGARIAVKRPWKAEPCA